MAISDSRGLQPADIATCEGFRNGKSNIFLACKSLHTRIMRIIYSSLSPRGLHPEPPEKSAQVNRNSKLAGVR